MFSIASCSPPKFLNLNYFFLIKRDLVLALRLSLGQGPQATYNQKYTNLKWV
jgi:hypothetical protein